VIDKQKKKGIVERINVNTVKEKWENVAANSTNKEWGERGRSVGEPRKKGGTERKVKLQIETSWNQHPGETKGVLDGVWTLSGGSKEDVKR